MLDYYELVGAYNTVGGNTMFQVFFIKEVCIL
jgi:hypothetical protein